MGDLLDGIPFDEEEEIRLARELIMKLLAQFDSGAQYLKIGRSLYRRGIGPDPKSRECQQAAQIIDLMKKVNG